MASDSFPPAQLKEIVNEVATLLKEKKETVAVAETVRYPAISVIIRSLCTSDEYDQM